MTTPAIWDQYLTDQDRTVRDLAGFGRRQGFGRKTALLIIDVTQNFCGDRREPLLDSVKRWRNSCGEAAWDAASEMAELLAVARQQGVPIIYSAGMVPDANPLMSGRARDKNSRRGEDADPARRGGHEIIEPVAPQPGDIVIRKSKPSVFYGTPLDSYLVDLGVDTIIACGGSTSGCVRATVVDGFSRNYRMIVPAEACFDRFGASHAMTLFDLDQKYADIMSVAEVKSVLSGAPLTS